MATKVKTKAGEVTVQGGKEVVADNLKGFKDGDKLVIFKRDEMCKFQFSYSKEHTKVKHVPEGTIVTMHVLDAAVAEKLGKGKIVKDEAVK